MAKVSSMCILISKSLHQFRSAIRNSQTLFVKINPFSTSLTSIDQTPNQHSFTVNYLVKSCGFAPEKALTTSKYLNFKTPEKPDSVIEFFCNHGFTKTQALNLIGKFPQLLSSDPEKTLLPKLEFFKSKGFPSTDVVRILSLSPFLLKTSLEKHIIPSFNFVKKYVGSEERTITAINHFSGLLMLNLKTRIAPNVGILREAGVPDAKIAFLLINRPRVFGTSCERFRQIVEDVKEMGFNPLIVNFVLAVYAMIARSKPNWEKRIEVYKRWGLTEDEILVAFGKFPWCMTVSEDKIMRVMDFLVNKMGWESSFVLQSPMVISYSFEKRTVPRCLVYEALRAKGLIKKTDINLNTMLASCEELFIKKVVNLGKEEAPELLKLYKEKLALAK